ncbi:MAG: recombinase family protein [Phenylobacterium zucineum]|nr:MAG: recombinase family protein [Phenylobacterium zucineum]
MHLIPAAQYLRMSTDFQRYSLANQRATITAYAMEHGYEIVCAYEDSGRSGVTVKRRAGLKGLLADVVSGEAAFTHILVVDVSRWGRFQDPDEAAHYEFICREAGVAVVYCAEVFPNDATGSIMKQLKRVMAGEYSRELSRKVRQGTRRVALRGETHGGAAPFGFRRGAFHPDGSLAEVLDHGQRRSRIGQTVKFVWGPPAELKTLKRIFRWYVVQRLTPTQIASRLNADGIPWRLGRPWKNEIVVKVLTNEIAAGVMVFNKTSTQLGGSTHPLPPDQWIRRQVCEPVVPRKLFLQAQARHMELRGRKRTDSEMLEAARRMLQRTGRLSQKDIQWDPDMPAVAVYSRRFGSLSRLYEILGYDVSQRADGRLIRCSREEVIEGLRRVHREHGGINTQLIDSDLQLPTAKRIAKRFGPLKSLYKEAGIALSVKGWRSCALDRSGEPPSKLPAQSRHTLREGEIKQ